MIHLMKYIARRYDIINELDRDKYTFAVWHGSLKFFKKYKGRLKALER